MCLSPYETLPAFEDICPLIFCSKQVYWPLEYVFTSLLLTFLLSGVPVVHLITYPFPEVWHKTTDNAQAIDWTFVSNFRKILTVFIHEYFHLQ